MKTQVLSKKCNYRAISFIALIMLSLLAFNPVNGQTKTTNDSASTERTVKGKILDANGPLKDVNVIQKGTNNGTVTNAKGEFTFPVKLKAGDILVFSYLGYETQKVTIKEDTTFINIALTEDLIEMIGALDTDKPYKSKRKNKTKPKN